MNKIYKIVNGKAVSELAKSVSKVSLVVGLSLTLTSFTVMATDISISNELIDRYTVEVPEYMSDGTLFGTEQKFQMPNNPIFNIDTSGVIGDITYQDDSQFSGTSISQLNINNVTEMNDFNTGHLRFRELNMDNLEIIHGSTLGYGLNSGNVYGSDVGKKGGLNFPNLKTIEGDFDATSYSRDHINMPLVSVINGGISIRDTTHTDLSSLTHSGYISNNFGEDITMSLNSLKSANNISLIGYGADARLKNFSLPSLQSYDNFTLSSNLDGDFELNSINTVNTSIGAEGNNNKYEINGDINLNLENSTGEINVRLKSNSVNIDSQNLNDVNITGEVDEHINITAPTARNILIASTGGDNLDVNATNLSELNTLNIHDSGVKNVSMPDLQQVSTIKFKNNEMENVDLSRVTNVVGDSDLTEAFSQNTIKNLNIGNMNIGDATTSTQNMLHNLDSDVVRFGKITGENLLSNRDKNTLGNINKVKDFNFLFSDVDGKSILDLIEYKDANYFVVDYDKKGEKKNFVTDGYAKVLTKHHANSENGRSYYQGEIKSPEDYTKLVNDRRYYLVESPLYEDKKKINGQDMVDFANILGIELNEDHTGFKPLNIQEAIDKAVDKNKVRVVDDGKTTEVTSNVEISKTRDADSSEIRTTVYTVKALTNGDIDGTNPAAVSGSTIHNYLTTNHYNKSEVDSLLSNPVKFFNDGTNENGVYTQTGTSFDIALNKLNFDFGEGLKVEKVEKDGKEYALVTLENATPTQPIPVPTPAGVDKDYVDNTNSQVTVGDNLGVSDSKGQNGETIYNITLNKDIDLGDDGSVSAGGVTINNQGINAGNKTITNLSAPLQALDATNKKYVDDTNTVVTVGNNLSVSSSKGKKGETTYNVSLNKDVDLGEEGSVSAGGVNIDKNGINANNKKVKNVADGEISETSKEAVNGSQLYHMQQQINNIKIPDFHLDTSRLDKLIANNAKNIRHLNDKMKKMDKRLTRGIAMSGAMGMLAQPTEPGKSMVSAAVSNYDGEQALAIGVSAISENNHHIIKLSGATSFKSSSKVMVGASYGYQW